MTVAYVADRTQRVQKLKLVSVSQYFGICCIARVLEIFTLFAHFRFVAGSTTNPASDRRTMSADFSDMARLSAEKAHRFMAYRFVAIGLVSS